MTNHHPVTNPLHYVDVDSRECIDFIRAVLSEAGFKAFCLGQVLKYVWRAGKKGDTAEDLAKANWYRSWLIGRDPREER